MAPRHSRAGKLGGKKTAKKAGHMAAIARLGGRVVAARPGHMKRLGQLSGLARKKKT